MKNKRLVYLLLPLVLVVWGLIAQRIWSAATDSAPDSPTVTGGNAPVATRTAGRNQRPALLLTYADPFKPLLTAKTPGLTTAVPQQNSARTTAMAFAPVPFARRNTQPLTPTTSLPVATLPVVWPQVKYLGLIKSTKENNQIALLSIDNQESIIKVGQSNQGVQLVKLFRDSVQLSFNKQKKSFHRNLGI